MDLSGVIIEKFIKCLTTTDLESDEMVSTVVWDWNSGSCASNYLFNVSETSCKNYQQIWRYYSQVFVVEIPEWVSDPGDAQ